LRNRCGVGTPVTAIAGTGSERRADSPVVTWQIRGVVAPAVRGATIQPSLGIGSRLATKALVRPSRLVLGLATRDVVGRFEIEAVPFTSRSPKNRPAEVSFM